MNKKIWEKNDTPINTVIESYTVGDDYKLDEYHFLSYDIEASAAHVDALEKAEVVTKLEADSLKGELYRIKRMWERGNLKIRISDEDCHTVIEDLLTSSLGKLGKKIHTGRSRNDQALTMIRLYMNDQLGRVIIELNKLQNIFYRLREEYRYNIFVGYTHTQQAMPTTIGHYFDSFVEQTGDDIEYAKMILKSISKNPLGSGAGFGSSVPLDRDLTKTKLGFDSIQVNSLYCQNSRGKFELKYVHALSQIMFTLQKLATDMLLFTSREFGFFKPDDSITTGSSMMPQKKNLDVAELIRANHGMITGIETQISTLSHGLMSGYNRDMQLIKGPLVQATSITRTSIEAASVMLENIEPDHEAIKAAFKKDICAADMATKMSLEFDIPFRDAYKKVMEDNIFDVSDIEALVKARKSLGSPGNF